MTPEEQARERIDARLEQSGWVVQNLKKVNLFAASGVAVREYPHQHRAGGLCPLHHLLLSGEPA